MGQWLGQWLNEYEEAWAYDMIYGGGERRRGLIAAVGSHKLGCGSDGDAENRELRCQLLR